MDLPYSFESLENKTFIVLIKRFLTQIKRTQLEVVNSIAVTLQIKIRKKSC